MDKCNETDGPMAIITAEDIIKQLKTINIYRKANEPDK